jgi:hypothetical protein
MYSCYHSRGGYFFHSSERVHTHLHFVQLDPFDKCQWSYVSIFFLNFRLKSTSVGVFFLLRKLKMSVKIKYTGEHKQGAKRTAALLPRSHPNFVMPCTRHMTNLTRRPQ